MSFPYAAILKQAYDFTRSNIQVWALGIFVSFASAFHVFLLNIFLDRGQIEAFRLPLEFARLWDFLQSQLLGANAGVVFLFVFTSALCRSALISSAQKMARNEPVTIDTALVQGSKFVWRVLAAQVLLFCGFLLLLGVLAFPVVYLGTIREIGRTAALTVLGLAIFIPVSVFLGFMFVYSPVCAVLYKLTTRSAMIFAFQLTQAKLKESLILAAFLLGIWLGFL